MRCAPALSVVADPGARYSSRGVAGRLRRTLHSDPPAVRLAGTSMRVTRCRERRPHAVVRPSPSVGPGRIVRPTGRYVLASETAGQTNGTSPFKPVRSQWRTGRFSMRKLRLVTNPDASARALPPRETSRTVLPGSDAEDDTRCELIAMRRDDGSVAFHMPARSRTLVLPEHRVAELAAALADESPTEVVVCMRDRRNNWTFAPATVRYGADLSEGTVKSLARGVTDAVKRVARLGSIPAIVRKQA